MPSEKRAPRETDHRRSHSGDYEIAKVRVPIRPSRDRHTMLHVWARTQRMMLRTQIDDGPRVRRAKKKKPTVRHFRHADLEQAPCLDRDLMTGEPVRDEEIIYCVQPRGTKAIVLEQCSDVLDLKMADRNPLLNLG